jgi:hypothetical protein
MISLLALVILSLCIGILLSISTSWLFNIVTLNKLPYTESKRSSSYALLKQTIKKYERGSLSEEDKANLWSSMMDYVSTTKSKDHALTYLSAICKHDDPELKSLCANSKIILNERFINIQSYSDEK